MTTEAETIKPKRVRESVPYETRVKTMLAAGTSVADVATKLGITARAVRVHQAKADGKLGMKELAAASTATYRQVWHWATQGYIKPIDLGEVKGEGTQRKGSGSDVVFEPEVLDEVNLAVELIAIGFEVEAAFYAIGVIKTSGVLAHLGTGEPATAMITYDNGWKLVREIS